MLNDPHRRHSPLERAPAHDTDAPAAPSRGDSLPSENAPHTAPTHTALPADRRAARGTPPSWYSGVVDRRSGIDRRDIPLSLNAPASPSQRPAGAAPAPTADTGLERRRGAGRRLSDSLRAAEDGSLTPEQFLFVKAIDAFKQANACTFPAWTDVLEVIRLLGYRKTAPSQLHLPACEDWLEKPDAPTNVRPKGFERRTNRAA